MVLYSSGITKEELRKRIMESPEKVICATHRRDLDGLGSAVFLIRYAGLPIGNILFGDHEVHDMQATLDELRSRQIKDGIAIFTDLPLDQNVNGIAEQIIGFLKGNGNIVVWLDHHRVGDESERIIRKSDFAVYGQGEICGSELVYEYIVGLKDDYGNGLAEMAHASDFYILGTRYEKSIISISGAITYLNYSSDDNGLRRIMADMANGDYLSSYIKENSGNYDKEAKLNAEILRKDVTVHKIGNLAVGIGHAVHIDANDACRKIMIKEFKCSIGILIAEDRINMRSEDSIDCSILARSLGGGGHPQAAGATPIGSDFKTREGIERIRKMILEKALEIYA